MALAWTTEDELNLIRRLALKDPERLKKYAEGMVHREHWGNLNKNLIKRSVSSTLRELDQT